MKKAEFVSAFIARREAAYRLQVKAGLMRESEAAMGMADAPKDAAAFWKRHRATLAAQDASQYFYIPPHDPPFPGEKLAAPAPVPAAFDLGSIVLHGEETPLASAIVPDLWHVYSFLKANHPELIMSYLGKDISAADAVKLCWHLAHSLKSALVTSRQRGAK